MRAEPRASASSAARATELEHGFPFGVVRQLFERTLVEADDGERERWLSGAAALATEICSQRRRRPARGRRRRSVSGVDPGYAWQHGLYWLASNLSTDSPLVLVVDDLQWCDAPSASALAFIARRLEGQPLGLILATRPLDPALTPEAATLAADPATELLRPRPLSKAAIGALVAARLSDEPDERFVRACLEVTGGNPFLLGELLGEASARGLQPTAAAATEVGAIVPRGVANAVLLRLARLSPAAAALAARSASSETARRSATRRGWPGSPATTSKPRWRRWCPPASCNPGAGFASRTRSCAPRSTTTCRPPSASGCMPRQQRSCVNAEPPPDKSRHRSCTPSRPPDPRPSPCCATRRAGHWPWATQPRRPPYSPARSTSLPATTTATPSCSSLARRMRAPAHRRRSRRCLRSSIAARTRSRSVRRRSS